MAIANLNITEKKQEHNYYSMKAYNLGDHYEQKFKSPLSDQKLLKSELCEVG